MKPPSPSSDPQLDGIDASAVLLIVSSGMLSLMDSSLPNEYETAPLFIGLALLLVNHARQQPMRYLYLALLLLLPRVYLQGDERYLFSEISLFDYILIIIGFAASHRLALAFWRLLFSATALALPLACLVSHQIRSGPARLEAFNAGDLSINQTALLMGSCLTLSLCFLWNALAERRQIRLTVVWFLASLLPLAMVLSTHSRFGLGLPLVATALVLVIADRHKLRFGLQRLSAATERGASQLGLPYSAAWGAVGLKLAGLGLLASGASVLAMRIYSSPRNQVSDLHRLHMLKCYLLAPLSGENRLIYGMGFTRASETICKDIGLIKGTTHAHNIFAQVSADNGLFALAAVVAVAAWVLTRIIKMAWRNEHPLMITAATLNLFILISLQIEGGWGKVSWIQALMGLTLGSLTMKTTSSRAATARTATTMSTPGVPIREMMLNDS